VGRTKEIAKEQGLNRLLLFTETGEGSCNMACKYCFLGKSGTNKKMSVEILHKAIDFLNLYAVGEPSLHFFGTEPLKNWDLILAAREYTNMMISLTTNGVALTKERIDWMDNNNVRVYILSLDGGEEHNINRILRNGDPAWAVVSRNAQMLLESPKQRSWVTARGTWSGHDYDLVGRFRELEGLGFPSIQLVPDVTGPFERDKVKEAYLELGEYYVWGATPSKFVNEMIQRLMDEENAPQEGNKCGTGRGIWTVSPDGSLSLCQMYEETSVGKIGDIWNGITNEMPFTAISERVNTFHTPINPYPKPGCEGCTAYKHCQGVGWCAGINRQVNGDELIAPDGYCEHLIGMVEACRIWAEKQKERLPTPKTGILGRVYGRG
jgi:uncharacterized protein